MKKNITCPNCGTPIQIDEETYTLLTYPQIVFQRFLDNGLVLYHKSLHLKSALGLCSHNLICRNP